MDGITITFIGAVIWIALFAMNYFCGQVGWFLPLSLKVIGIVLGIWFAWWAAGKIPAPPAPGTPSFRARMAAAWSANKRRLAHAALIVIVLALMTWAFGEYGDKVVPTCFKSGAALAECSSQNTPKPQPQPSDSGASKTTVTPATGQPASGNPNVTTEVVTAGWSWMDPKHFGPNGTVSFQALSENPNFGVYTQNGYYECHPAPYDCRIPGVVTDLSFISFGDQPEKIMLTYTSR